MKKLSMVSLVLLVFASVVVRADPLPLASVRYFNDYQNPTNWGGWSTIYQGGGASVRSYAGKIPVVDVGGVRTMVLDAVNPPGGYWNVQFKVSGNPLNMLRVGTNGAVHLRLLWGAIPTNGAWNMKVGVGGQQVYLASYLTPSTNVWQDIYIPFSDLLAVKPDLDLTHAWLIDMKAAGNYRDHCTLYLAALDVVPSATRTNFTEFVKVNQVGYAPEAEKIAFVSWPTNMTVSAPTSFQVVNVANSHVVLSGSLSSVPRTSGWDLDGDVICRADFSALKTPGTYRVEVPSLSARSQPFVIAADVYRKLFRDSLRFFYYSRSSLPIADPHAEGYTRATLHAEDTRASYNYDPNFGNFNFGSQTNRDVHGCWYDAGDTHIDVYNTSVACWWLLETMRDFGGQVPPASLNLPESNAQQSDLVPLIMNAVEWMQRMQNPDGSVCAYLWLGNTHSVSDIASCPTAYAAGTFAKAYAVMGASLPPTQASNLLASARLSWGWLTNHPNVVLPRLRLNNGVDGGGWDSAWGSTNGDRAARAFAAVQLFEATGEAPFNSAFTNAFLNLNGGSPLDGLWFGFNKTGYGGDNVISYLQSHLNFAFMDYARCTWPTATASVQATLKSAFLHQADVLTIYTALSGYRIPMLWAWHLYWGSSGGILVPSAAVLQRAYEWTGNAAYHAAAVDALHFICGRNPVDRVFVSGYGDYQHSSDFFSTFWTDLLRQPPGHLGGNINLEFDLVAKVIEQPWKRFINMQDAAMTEPGVYWNSSFAWLVGSAVQKAMGQTGTNTFAAVMPGGSVDVDLAPLASGTGLAFTVSGATNGSAALLADGHTVRFTPSAGYNGPASFGWQAAGTATPGLLRHYTFELPDTTADGRATDSAKGTNGILTSVGTGSYAYESNIPAAFAGRQAQSLRLAEPSANNYAKLSTAVSATEHNFSTASWTASAWFKRATTSSHDFIFHAGAGDGFAGEAYELYLYGVAGADTVKLTVYGSNGTTVTVDITSATGSVPVNTWHHAAVVWQAAGNNNGTFKFYLDGTLVGTSASIAFVPNQASAFVFGGSPTTLSWMDRQFNGWLDDCALFSKALSGTEVAALATGPVSAGGSLAATGTVVLNVDDSTNGLLARWPFDAAWSDVTGHGWNLTPVDHAELTPTPAKQGAQSLSLDGSGDYAYTAPLPFVDAFTLAAWIYMPSSATNTMTVAANSFGDIAASGFRLFANGSSSSPGVGSLVLETGNGSAGLTVASATGILAKDRWQHVAAVVNRAADIATLYRNGSAVATGGIRTDFTNSTSLWLGGMSGTAFPFQSRLDDVRLYSRALTSNEVATIVNAFNLPPTLSDVTNRTVLVNVGSGPIVFTVSDLETAPEHLTLSASSSATGMVRQSDIAFGGNGSARTVTILPVSNRLGSATVTLTVNDGTRVTNSVFTVTVVGTQQQTWRFDRFGTTSSTGVAADGANPDGDAWDNAQEYVLGTDPWLVSPGLKFESAEVLGSGLRLTFQTLKASGVGYAGLSRLYDVESAAMLPTMRWSGVPGLINLLGTNGTMTVTVPFEGPQKFFRLSVRLQ